MPIRRETIRWVAFDVAGTLLFADPPVAEAYHRVAARHGSRLTPEEIHRRFRSAFQTIEREECAGVREDALATDENHEQDRWQRIVAETLCDVDDPRACFAELFAHFARPDAWQCPPETAGSLKELKQAGFRLALASNFDQRLERIADNIEAFAPIEVTVISSLVGWRKPSRYFYDELIRRCQCAPAEILMVGDGYENDVAGARRAGLQAVHLCRDDQSPHGDAISSLHGLVEQLRA
jgi:putative hydrolase of the HAD superfamily